MRQLIFNTGNDLAGLILRLTLGLIMFPHGAQKAFGWFNGPGFTKEMEHLQHLNIPWIFVLLVILIEFFGAISLIFGFASRLWAIAFFILFVGIIYTAHLQFGFFMNWFGKQQGEGFEYHLLVLGICLALCITGSGKFSIDNLIQSK